jgi:hypothetical protein
MHMIFNTTHDQGRRFEVVACPSEIGVKSFAERVFAEERPALFG